MNRYLFAGLLGLGVFLGSQPEPVKVPDPVPKPSPDCPDGKCPVKPSPTPQPPRKPWGERTSGCPCGGPCLCDPCRCRPLPTHPAFTEFAVDDRTHDGEDVTCDLPNEEHLRNKGGSDGAGLCVFCSIDHAARWQNVPALIGFRDWMTKFPGGGYPEKVAAMIPRMCRDKGLPVPDYVQHTGGDLDFLKLALKTGRYPAVTYDGRDGKFYGGRIAHMVNLVHLSDKWAVIHDNNYPHKYLWMSPSEFASRWRGNGGGWAVVLLNPGPPPVPTNKQTMLRSLFLATAISCPGGVCDTPAVASPVPAPTGHRWVDVPGTPDKALYAGSVQVGAYLADGRGYHRLDGGAWDLNVSDPPVSLPDGAVQNYGVDTSKIPSTKSYSLNGKKCEKWEAVAAVEGNLVDDSTKLRLTVVFADKATRDRVVSDISTDPALTSWRDKLLVQSYPPDHWAVKNVGFAEGITFQPASASDGRAPVLFRMTEYKGPADLATALRKADPSYTPTKDPDPAKPPVVGPKLPDAIANLPQWVWVVGVVLLVLFLTKKEDPK